MAAKRIDYEKVFADIQQDGWGEVKGALSASIRARLLVMAVRRSFPSSTPDENLSWAVVKLALLDLGENAAIVRAKAHWYLSGDIYHARLVGVEASYIQEQAARAGLM